MPSISLTQLLRTSEIMCAFVEFIGIELLFERNEVHSIWNDKLICILHEIVIHLGWHKYCMLAITTKEPKTKLHSLHCTKTKYTAPKKRTNENKKPTTTHITHEKHPSKADNCHFFPFIFVRLGLQMFRIRINMFETLDILTSANFSFISARSSSVSSFFLLNLLNTLFEAIFFISFTSHFSTQNIFLLVEFVLFVFE